MTPERWARITEVFRAALEKPVEERAAYLDEACGGDEPLRRNVERLLAGEAEPSLPSPLPELWESLAPGETLAQYRVEAKIGEGGMGAVYRAYDTRLHRKVALKVLPPEHFADPERKSRLTREARAASALNHPNIVTIYEIGSDRGVDFIGMEFVAGKTLAESIGRKGLPLDDTLKYAVQITSALAAAHAEGIVHRDLKPANVMVNDAGQVKVLDFGLAKGMEPAADEETRTAHTMPAETETGTILGTVAYMSPEQAEGRKVDARSDVFTFGVVLYEMVTGKKAFQRDSTAATMAAILKEEPAPAGEGLPPEMGKILTRCLRKDRERRFQHMSDLKVALEELKEESDSGRLGAALSSAAPAVKGRRLRAAAWTAALLAVMGVAVLAVWFVRQTTQQTPAALPNAVPLTSYPGHERYPSFSPDGNQVAFSWNGEKQDNFDIYVKLIGPGTPLRLTSDPADDTSPAWSPDGRYIAFVRLLPAERAGIFLVPALGGPERQLVETRLQSFRSLPAVFLAWSPDSRWLVVPDKSVPNEPQSLMLLSIETGEKRKLTSPPARRFDVGPALSQDGDLGPALSPDGRTLAFLRASQYGVNDLYLLELSDELMARGEPRRLTFDKKWIASPVWTPDGREILFASDRLGAGRRSLWRIKVSSPAGRLGEPQALASLGQGVWSVGISRHGPAGRPTARLAYSQQTYDANIWRIEVPGPEAAPKGAPLVASTRAEWGPQFSPDGKRIVFWSDRSGSIEYWLCDRNGSNAVQLTSFGGPDLGPVRWSPDGEHLVFQGYLEGQSNIYVMNANGGGLRRLTNDPDLAGPPSWSRDGRWIYFPSGGELWKMPTNGGTAVRVTRKGGNLGLESPDGKFVYYAKYPNPPSLWKVPVDGGEETQVLESLANSSTFAVADEGIYFIPRSSLPTSLQLFSFGTGKIKQIATIEKPVSNGLSVSAGPDGRSLWILYTQVDQEGSDLMLLENFR